MYSKRHLLQTFCLLLMCVSSGNVAFAQRSHAESDAEFGPVVRTYLGYLRDEQEVVDDRVSRREVSPAYYRRNSNRIRALRQIAVRIARESGNDYLPELEAVAANEMKTLFENPPSIASFRVGQIYGNTFRYLGAVRSGEIFYLFARLNPYEQAELMRKEKSQGAATDVPNPLTTSGIVTNRQRRAGVPK